MWGKHLEYGDVGHVSLLRLGRGGQWHGRVHETWQVAGPVGHLKSPLYHYPHPDYVEFLHHINNYSTLRAGELKTRNCKTSLLEIIFFPLGKFLSLYLIKLGFLDGTMGFIHAMTMSFYTFLVRAKLYLSYD